jgi:hypothetical protein
MPIVYAHMLCGFKLYVRGEMMQDTNLRRYTPTGTILGR